MLRAISYHTERHVDTHGSTTHRARPGFPCKIARRCHSLISHRKTRQSNPGYHTPSIISHALMSRAISYHTERHVDTPGSITHQARSGITRQSNTGYHTRSIVSHALVSRAIPCHTERHIDTPASTTHQAPSGSTRQSNTGGYHRESHISHSPV